MTWGDGRLFVWHILNCSFNAFINTHTQKGIANVVAAKTCGMLLLQTMTC